MSDFLIRHISLQGFRAYLKPRRFDLSRGSTALSLALFAENGHGKSSLADGFEFYLSPNGTLDHLGVNANTTKGGAAALRHVDAAASGIDASVTVCFDLGGARHDESRKLGGAAPAAVAALLPHIPVDPIIRGRDLRGFVEQSEADRYKHIASWFGLQPLIDLQEDLGKLKRLYKASAADTAACDVAVAGLSKLTDGAVPQWGEPEVLDWVNDTLVRPLKDAEPMSRLSRSDEGYQRLVELKAAEDLRLGLPRLRQLKSTAEDIVGSPADDAGGLRKDGKAANFQAAQARLDAAQQALDAALTASANAIQSPVWTEAVELLEQDAYVNEACPVCATPFDATKAGSRKALLEDLKGRIAALAVFNSASAEKTQAQAEVTKSTNGLCTALALLQNQFETAERPPSAALVKMVANTSFTAADLSLIVAEVTAAADALDVEIAEQEAAQGVGSCKGSLEKLDKILDMAAARRNAEIENAERKAILKAVENAAKIINADIQSYVGGVLDALRQEVNGLYKRIVRFPNGAAPPDVNLTLPATGKKADKMCLTIDFAETCKGVAPGGYLSDAQLHSLGLALRLCAIRRFNAGARFIVLDDVVTSYDRDHRQLIANMLATDFEDFQIIVVTHERQFFEYLREKLPLNRWALKQISQIEPTDGPVLVDDRPSDEEIEDLLRSKKPAGVIIRKAQEVWLQRICYEFGVSVTMPSPTDLPKFGRAELARALESFVKDRKMDLDMSCFAQLNRGAAEHADAHGNLDQSNGPSDGDMSVRWQEFKEFQSQFTCSCGGKRFHRPQGMHNPHCRRKGCELPFKGIPVKAGGAA